MPIRPTEPIEYCRARASHHLLIELDLRFPFWTYVDLYDGDDYAFLLDSAKDSERLGRYSFLGGDPFLVFRAKRQAGVLPGGGATIEIEERATRDGKRLREPAVRRLVAEPFETLRALLRACAIDYDAYTAHPVAMLSGAVGYFGYEAGYFIEELPDRGDDDLGLPDIYFLFVDTLLAHCHRSGKSYLSVVGRGEDAAEARQNAATSRDAMLERLAALESRPAPPRDAPDPRPRAATEAEIDVRRHFDRRAYVLAVETIKDRIAAGDVFEVCMTHRFESPLAGGTARDLYRELRRLSPAPFACYLRFPEAEIVSSSPERFLRLGPDGIAESRPIKGTRRRGTTPEEDDALYRELLSSEKDRAENVMIVDLVRNDLGRVSKFGSVRVSEFMVIEDYATVFQMVSAIRGELREGLDGLDLVKAAFPGGSMTGAPKIEAMKIIDSLEPVKRGIYSGAIGYLDFAGPLDLSIVIRTAVVKDGVCYYGVGGAVVADSDPGQEYEETLDKARALMAALRSLKAGR